MYSHKMHERYRGPQVPDPRTDGPNQEILISEHLEHTSAAHLPTTTRR